MENHTGKDTVPELISVCRSNITDLISAEYCLYRALQNDRYSFSIKVTLSDDSDSAFVQDITSDPVTAHRILSLLVNGTVTPCCVFEVVEDIIETIL